MDTETDAPVTTGERAIDSATAAWLNQEPSDLDGFYGMMRYQLGFEAAGEAVAGNVEELKLGAMICLLSCEAAAGSSLSSSGTCETARKVAAAVALLFTSFRIHDDIERQEALTSAGPAVADLWGMAQAINTGDGLFSLAIGAMLRADNGLVLHSSIRLSKAEKTARGALLPVRVRSTARRLLLSGSLCRPSLRNGALDASLTLARELTRTSLTYMAGQHLLLTAGDDATPEECRQIAELTRGAPLGFSAWAGAVAAGADEDIRRALHEFGEALGTAVAVREGAGGFDADGSEAHRYLQKAVAALQNAGLVEEGRRRLEEFARQVVAAQR